PGCPGAFPQLDRMGSLAAAPAQTSRGSNPVNAAPHRYFHNQPGEMIGFVHNLLFTDFWLKLFSLVLAILIWITVHLAISNEASPIGQFSPRVARTFTDLPIVILSSAADVHTFRVTPDRVEVTVQAERQIMDKLQAKDIRVLVDVTDIEEARDVRI